jgi:hypothetical protein
VLVVIGKAQKRPRGKAPVQEKCQPSSPQDKHSKENLYAETGTQPFVTAVMVSLVTASMPKMLKPQLNC